MIHFWDDTRLAWDLKDNNVREIDKFIYLVSYIVLPGLIGPCLWISCYTEKHSRLWIITTVLVTLLLGLALFYCLLYRKNSKGDGRNFVERCICLSVAVNLRLCVLVLVLVGIIGPIAGIAQGLTLHFIGPGTIFTFIDFSTIVIVTAISTRFYFKRLCMLFEIASGQVLNRPELQPD